MEGTYQHYRVQYGVQVPILQSAVWRVGTNITECSMVNRYQHYRVQFWWTGTNITEKASWRGTNITECGLMDRYQPNWPRPHSPLISVFKAIRRHSALTHGYRNVRGVNTLQFLEFGNDVTDTAIHSTGFWLWQHSVLQQIAPFRLQTRNDAVPEPRFCLAISTLHTERLTNTKQRTIPKCTNFLVLSETVNCNWAVVMEHFEWRT